MKNIEYYQNTKDALEAYVGAYRKDEIGDMPFDIWLEQEYVEPRFPTLLEAAEDALRAWDKRDEYGNLEWVKDRMRQLSVAIKRERHKPVRNCDRFATAEEAWTAFKKMCNVNNCRKCPFGEYRNDYVNCRFIWLYAEADKEETK